MIDTPHLNSKVVDLILHTENEGSKHTTETVISLESNQM